MLDISSNPFFPQAATNSSSGSSSSSSPSAPADNGLNANSFITLLTTQLQAQDPLSPMDPSQMVTELTQMNTFEQLLQIRQDMDALLGQAQGGGAAGGASTVAAKAADISVPSPSADALHAGLLTSLTSSHPAIPFVSNSLSRLF